MLTSRFFIRFLISVVLLFCLPFLVLTQEPVKTPVPTPSNEEADDEILKIEASLIQTGVGVFDKNGAFVKGLKREDFELLVDGKPVSPTFFDQVTIRNNNGEVIKEQNNKSSAASAPIAISEGGRTVVFVVDDMHLSFDSHKRTRDLILKFVDEQMMPTDTVAIVSSSGKIGFLQQFTNDKVVLRAAVKRLIFGKNTSANDPSPPPMTEYEAQSIDRLDREVTDVFVKWILRDNPRMNPRVAETEVQSRAQNILYKARAMTANTLAALEESTRRAGLLPGRKAVYFISDGFLLDTGNSTSASILRRITNMAARSNTIIYSFDAKGLDAAPPDGFTAGVGVGANPATGFQLQAGSRLETQDGLSYVANNTGGQFIHNTNDLKNNLTKVTEEAFTYYLIAWEPETDNAKSEKLKRIEVSVKGKPELKVRVQSGYLDEAPATAANTKKETKPAVSAPVNPKAADEQKLISAANSQIPKRELPTALALNYLDMANEGALLSASIQINTDAIEFTRQNGEAAANIEIFGVIYNAEGKQEKAFKVPLKINTPAENITKAGVPDIYYDYKANLKPGLYQMRVSARDTKSGRLGSAIQWLEIPDISAKQLTLSSLLLGERKAAAQAAKETAQNKEASSALESNVDRRFDRSSSIRYLVFVYNAKGTGDEPTVQMQIIRQGKVLMTQAAQQTAIGAKDPARLPYTGEISLNELIPGRYELKMTATDRAAKTSAVRQMYFEIK